MSSSSYNQRIAFTLALTVFAVLHLGLEILKGGVVTHHLLASADMPGFSNWWGLLLLPALGWFLYPFMSGPQVSSGVLGISRTALYRMGGAIVYGAVLAAAFEFGNEQVPAVMMGVLFPLGIVFPLYRAELVLGMVVGMTYTFGVVIPGIVVGVVAGVSFVTNSLGRFVYSRVRGIGG